MPRNDISPTVIPTRRKKRLWICLGVVAALLVVHLATSPVVFRVPFFTQEHSDQPRFVLLNPFRSRAPEEAGNQALVSIQAGHCKETLESALDMRPEGKAHMCGMFAQIPLDVWELRNRRNSRDECELIYWHHGYPTLDVYMRKIEGRWKLTWINSMNWRMRLEKGREDLKDGLSALNRHLHRLSSRPERGKNLFPQSALERGVEGSRGCVVCDAVAGSSFRDCGSSDSRIGGHGAKGQLSSRSTDDRDDAWVELPKAARSGRVRRDLSTPRLGLLRAHRGLVALRSR